MCTISLGFLIQPNIPAISRPVNIVPMIADIFIFMILAIFGFVVALNLLSNINFLVSISGAGHAMGFLIQLQGICVPIQYEA
jgi:hypothetical protein